MQDLCLHERGKLELSVEPVNLKEVMTECIEVIEFQTKQRGVKIELDYDPNIPQLNSDRKRIQILFLNLLMFCRFLNI